MKCPKCEFENRVGVKFCESCGMKMELICPHCKAKIPPDRSFCGECGHDLSKPKVSPAIDYSQPQSYTPKFLADKILTTRSSIEGERKLVTVLFADVANYTSISEKLDPEEVHQIMDGCFKILMEEIHRYEGTINQFTGDGVMALFGAPVAHEDHVQRACFAALGIQEALEAYCESLKKKFRIDFKMRVGLNSGPVVVASIGDDLRMDYTAIGDTTNLAARIESIARPGSILLSKNTYKIVREYFKFSPLGKVTVKGKKEPLEIYQLEAKHEVYKPRLGLERQIYSMMVGRDSELERLERQVMKAANGEGSIVNIVGEAGIGKSRLVAELKNREVMSNVTLLEGRAISMGRNLAFHPIIDLFKHWAQIKEDDSMTAAFEKLRLSVSSVCQEETDQVVPFVATLMGMKLSGRYAERVKIIDGESLDKVILKNVRALLIKATDQTPMVIVVEDLHWADISSIELLESQFRLAETQGIAFINVFRPGHKETGDRIIETTRERFPGYYTEIVLQPLGEQTSETLINNMLNIRGLQHAVRRQIIERSGGNPFFIEEVVRSLIDEGAVVFKHGAFEVTDKIDKVFVPQTINDVLMARIDRLEETTRHLIKVASVIGRSFFYRIITDVVRTIEDIDQRLAYLKDIQLIRERRRMEELEYLFKHALAQEAAYESILVQKRKELHLKVADSIERVFTERLHEFYGMLAVHYSKGEDENKAEEYLIKAGEEALKSSASSEALHYYKQALKLYQSKHGDDVDPEKIAMLEKNIGLAFYNKGQLDESLEYFDKALSYYNGKEPKHILPKIMKFLIGFLDFLISIYIPSLKWKGTPTKRDIEIVNLIYNRQLALVIIHPKRWIIEEFTVVSKWLNKFDITKIERWVGILSKFSIIFSMSGISFRFSKKVLHFVKDKVDKSDLKSLLYYEFSAFFHDYLIGDWEREKEYDDDLVNSNLSIGELFMSLLYIDFHAQLNLERGLYTESSELIKKLTEIGNTYEHDFSREIKYLINTKALMKVRKLNDALEESNEGIDITKKTSNRLYDLKIQSYKARIQIMLGDIKGAEDSLHYVDKNRSEINKIPIHISDYLLSKLIFEVYQLEESIKKGNKSEYHIYRKNALKTGKKTVKNSWNFAADRTEAMKLMGTYYWLINKQKKAIKWWNKSLKEGERLDARLELSRTYMEVGKRLIEQNSKYKELNGISAAEHLEEARTMFEEMDLQWDINELKRIIVFNSALSTQYPGELKSVGNAIGP